MKKPSLLVIFLTVFIDLIGFGIVLPLLPRYSERFGAQGFMIGAIIASFSVMQFFFAPVWGKLSDRIGRRPVLLISNAGSAISYAMFALAAHPSLTPRMALGVLLTSRIFAGLCGANLSVASAYIADVTSRENRSKGMALIGVSFGLGFILGPALGALSANKFGLAAPGWVAATLCLGNFIFACFVLVESRSPSSESAASRPKLGQWLHTLSQPKVGLLVGLYFLSTFCFASFETTLPLLLGSSTFHPDDFVAPSALLGKLSTDQDPVTVQLRAGLSPEFAQLVAHPLAEGDSVLRRSMFNEFNRLVKAPSLFDSTLLSAVQPATNASTSAVQTSPVRLNRLVLERAYPAEIKHQTIYYDERKVGYIFAYCGLISLLIQGGVIGRLVKRFGEPKLIWGSLICVALSLALIPYAEHLAGLLIALALFAAGSGVNRAPTMGLISLHTPASEQGASMGVAQSAGTLARIAGPVFASTLYAVYPHSPYLIAAAIALGAGLIAWQFLCKGYVAPEGPKA